MFISAVQGAHLSYRSFYFLLSGIKEEIGMPFLHLLFFYVQNNSLAQSKPYAKVANLGWCILSFFVTNIHLFKVKSKAHKFFLDSWTPDRFDLKKKKKKGSCFSSATKTNRLMAGSHKWAGSINTGERAPRTAAGTCCYEWCIIAPSWKADIICFVKFYNRKRKTKSIYFLVNI